ncbi:MAG: hypothetical protein M1813_000849 [Trichoglossum hirsutum]|nr:MAG: hypothetical protein M1813_000849 [Trichoglossum hirsutum]
MPTLSPEELEEYLEGIQMTHPDNQELPHENQVPPLEVHIQPPGTQDLLHEESPLDTPPSEEDTSGPATPAEGPNPVPTIFRKDQAQTELVKAHVAFYEKFPEHEPKQVLEVIKYIDHVDPGLFYCCFRLTYPYIAQHIEAVRDRLLHLDNVLGYYVCGTSPLMALDIDWNWKLRLLLSRFSGIGESGYQFKPSYHEWCNSLEDILNAMRQVVPAWSKLKVEILQVDKKFEVLKSVGSKWTQPWRRSEKELLR